MNNKVLVIYSSMINQKKSYSYHLTEHFLKHYQSFNPNDEIIKLDLNNLKMANITLNQNNFNTYFNEADSDYFINQLKSVNKIIHSCPMTNFNITSLSKNYLDHILVANKTFSYKYSKKGEAIGLLNHLKVQILTTQGAPYGWYQWGNNERYLKGVWEFVGAQVNEPFLLAGTKVASENGGLVGLTIEQALQKFDNEIKELAKKL